MTMEKLIYFQLKKYEWHEYLNVRIFNKEYFFFQPPKQFSRVQDLSDLSDGVGFSAVISLYNPEDLGWSEIAVGDPTSMADSLYNIQMVQRFCSNTLPFNICHLTIEDIVYMHESVKLNVVLFLADLYDVIETRGTARRLPGVPRNKVIEVPDPGKYF